MKCLSWLLKGSDIGYQEAYPLGFSNFFFPQMSVIILNAKALGFGAGRKSRSFFWYEV